MAKQKYIVTMPGVHIQGEEQKVGSEIEITERLASNLVNKVVLASNYNSAKEDASKIEAVKKQLKKSKEESATLSQELLETDETISGLEEQIVKLNAEVAKLALELKEAKKV